MVGVGWGDCSCYLTMVGCFGLVLVVGRMVGGLYCLVLLCGWVTFGFAQFLHLNGLVRDC